MLPQLLNKSQLPRFSSVDVHLGWERELRRGRIEAYLDITNATDRTNVGGYEYEGVPPVREERRLLPAIPVVGLAWHFGSDG